VIEAGDTASESPAQTLQALADLCRARGVEIRSAPDVAQWLYGHWYTGGGTMAPPASGADLRSHLRAAPASLARWLDGWVVVETSDTGECVAGRDGAMRRLAPGDYGNLARPFAPPMPGDLLTVSARVDWSDPATGFWHLQSPAGPPGDPLLRLYVGVDADQAAAAIAAITAILDGAEARYALKCPSHAAGFARRDSLVVYLESAAWPARASDIRRLGKAVALRPLTPPLTLAIAPGLAIADDPGDGRSFGQAICEALAPAARAAAGDPDHVVAAAFGEALALTGFDPAAPWRRPER
jgi:hypothetical protein